MIDDYSCFYDLWFLSFQPKQKDFQHSIWTVSDLV